MRNDTLIDVKGFEYWKKSLINRNLLSLVMTKKDFFG